jgi:hypothetical protein
VLDAGPFAMRRAEELAETVLADANGLHRAKTWWTSMRSGLRAHTVATVAGARDA